MSSAEQLEPSKYGTAPASTGRERSVIRVFMSSPGDVDLERKLTERVISRLQAKYANRGAIEPYFWEYQPMSNYGTFQAQIPDCADFDIVICVLWSRLGTPLVAPDGKRYRSGVEYEVMSSRAAWEANGRPNLLIYLNTAPAQIRQFPDTEFERSIQQLRALKEFIAEYCSEPGTGENKGAYTTYSELGQFEQLIERHLDRLFDQQLPKEQAGGSPNRDQLLVWGRRSPFRGLEAFDFEHAAIFFGRTKAIGEVVNRLRKRMAEVEDARASRAPGAEIEPAAFLLVSAMSGVGKSSLIRAGVLPLLVESGAGGTVWRRATMRPSEATGDLFESLARALCRPEALPELVSGNITVESIADLLRRNPAGIEFGLVTALDRAAAGNKPTEPTDAVETASAATPNSAVAANSARLVLFVDQLEELFTLERVDENQRRGFITALAAVAKSGKAYVISTLRSDFFGRCAELPLLADLSQGDGLYHLLPPSVAELGQMIRQPATAAGLRFELHPETKESLDDRLRDAATRSPEALPLLQFCLEELYRAQERRNDGLLTHQDYEAMGGVEGSLARRAEQLFLSLEPEAQAQFDHVMRRVTTVVIEEAVAFNRRWAEYEELTKPAGDKAFVGAFLNPDARLFVVDRTDAGRVVVSVTHEALLTHWERLHRWLQDNRESLLTRAQVAVDAKRWLESEKNPDYLYRAGLPLEKARQTLAEGFLDSTERDFVDASTARAHAELIRRRRATRVVIGAISAALVLALVLAGLAFRQSRQAVKAKASADEAAKRATLARNEAGKLINYMTTDLRDKLKPIGRLDLLDEVNQRVLGYYASFGSNIRNPEVLSQSSDALANAGDIQKARGDLTGALKSYNQSLSIKERLAQQDPSHTDWQRYRALAIANVGDVLYLQGDTSGALERYQAALKILQTLVARESSNTDLQHDLSMVQENIGQVLDSRGDLSRALQSYQDCLAIREDLKKKEPTNLERDHDVSLVLLKIAGVFSKQANLADAIKSYKDSLAIQQKLADAQPANALWQQELATSKEQLGKGMAQQGDLAGALEMQREALEIRRKLTEQDPSNATWQRLLARSYSYLSLVFNHRGDLPNGFENSRHALEIQEMLAKRDPSNANAQCDLAIAYYDLGKVSELQGDQSGAMEKYQIALSINRKLADQDPNNSEWQRDLAIGLERVGTILSSEGDFSGALAKDLESLAIRKKLANRDESNAQWQNDLSWSYITVGNLFYTKKDLQEALSNYRTAQGLERELLKKDSTTLQFQSDLAVICQNLGDLLRAKDDAVDALSSYRECVGLGENLVRKDPTNGEWASELALACYSAAITLPKNGSQPNPETRALLERGRDLLVKLQTQSTLSPTDQRHLQEIQTALAGL
jgi:eukaryotic-like serine/threonine-protein kinase